MTGRNTGNTRIRDNMCTAGGIAGIKVNPGGDSTIVRRANLMPQDTTIATVLSAAGYRTCLVNKWHLDGYDKGASPNHRGFDEFYGWTISTVHSNSPYYYPYYRFHGDSLIHIAENAEGRHGIHNNDLSANDAIAFVQRNRHRPFFLYLAFDAPHEPYNIDQTGKVPVQSLENMIYFPDVMPTLAALAQGTEYLPGQLNGMNLLPLFYGQKLDTNDRLLYWEFPGKQRAARRGDWKCVTIRPNTPLELYNLKEDPEERHNLADRYPEMVEQFDREMQEMHRPTPNWPQPGESF